MGGGGGGGRGVVMGGWRGRERCSDGGVEGEGEV